ncbi:MAG: hypothetical protein KF830_18560 [Planctomycetes bacterium]|nr:hypothetical protein [Planctomycetota bacterium]
MRVVLVSSPGRGGAAHWSAAMAAAVAGELLAAGAEVEWLCGLGAGAATPPDVGAVRARPFPRRALGVHAVAAGTQDPALERALAHSLRAAPAAAVLHLGTGAGGSPSVTWLADRMGCAAFAVVRSAEIVCQRGDLVDAIGEPCTKFDDAARCRACCRRSAWRQPRADDLRNRWDLLLAGLLVAEAVFVADAADAERLASLGLARPHVVVCHRPHEVAGRLLAAPAR